MKENKKKGFTLVELLVVISVIALLMAILMPALSKARELAKRIVCGNSNRQIGVAIHSYSSRYDDLLPWWGYTPGGSEEMHPYVAYRIDKTDWIDLITKKPKPMRMGRLYESGFIQDAEIFYCPSNREPLYRYESYVDPPPWGTLPQKYNTLDQNGNSHNQWVRVGLVYYPTDPKSSKITGTVMDYPEYVCKKLEKLDTRIPYMADMMRNRDDISHKTRNTYGLHAMFSDGSVAFFKDSFIFEDRVWDDWENDAILWREFYYTVFSLIATAR